MDYLKHAASVPHEIASTTFDISGYHVIESPGVVRGVVVRSRSIFGMIGARVQTIRGGDISMLTSLAERAREQAFNTILLHAHVAGANAVIGVRYDANEMMQGVTEVLCYGTAEYEEEAADDQHVPARCKRQRRISEDPFSIQQSLLWSA